MKNKIITAIAPLLLVAVMASLSHRAAAQADKPQTEEETWRAGEKKFAEFMEMTKVLTQLDDPSSTNSGALVFHIPLTGETAQRTVSEIEKHCGTPYRSDTNKAGSRVPPELARALREIAPLLRELSDTNITEARAVWYGRFGYLTEDGKSIKTLWAAYSGPSLKKPDTKKK